MRPSGPSVNAYSPIPTGERGPFASHSAHGHKMVLRKYSPVDGKVQQDLRGYAPFTALVRKGMRHPGLYGCGGLDGHGIKSDRLLVRIGCESRVSSDDHSVHDFLPFGQ